MSSELTERPREIGERTTENLRAGTYADNPNPPAIAYRVVPLSLGGPNLPRILHGVGTRSTVQVLSRGFAVMAELGSSAVLDTLLPIVSSNPLVERGRAAASGRSIALFTHWSPDGRVSDMVRHQLALWASQGFSVVFITNANVPAADWSAVGEHAVLLIHRKNVGRDFGAWRDALAIATDRLGEPQELLLANDSVLGPIRPIGPIVSAWRKAGDGVFGMTESVAPKPHLQSYLLLARGRMAVTALAGHLAGFRNTRSKWRIVQKGEIALSRHILDTGILCGCIFDYRTLCNSVDPATHRGLGRRFADDEDLKNVPLNPTVHLWRPLVEAMGFPYLKREMLRTTPDPLSARAAWRDLTSEKDAALIDAHLRIMGIS